MTRSDHGIPEWLAGRAKPPLWFRLVGVLGFISATTSTAGKRGVFLGIVAAVTYGVPMLALLQWPSTTHWLKRHPLLDSLFFVPFLFFGLAVITKLSAVICLLIALLAGLPLIGYAAARRHNRSRRA